MGSKKINEKKIKPAIVESIEAGSIGDELGFEVGDQLISINGVKPRDLIDYKFLIAEDNLQLKILDEKGKTHEIEIEKDQDDELGLAFTEALFDGLKQCNNNCPFCFIDQQPSGKRKSLYLKDDDFRLSFLYGSYLTLTNLSEEEWLRIDQQRLTPLFVSVHATDPSLRAQLLKNPNAIELLQQLAWFSEKRIQIHAQIVVCPEINDGLALERTLNDLFNFAQGDFPAVLSAAVVPVGLTRFRPSNDGLRPVDAKCAKKVINQVESMQKIFYESTGSRFAWLSDEWYLLAKQPLPTLNSYEDFPQKENGVGSIRSFLKAMDEATTNLPKKIHQKRTCSWVVGKLVENELLKPKKRLNKIDNLQLHLYGIPSPYWGQEQIVTGLLTGQDLIQGLKDKELGDELLLPSVMLRQGEKIFLDDMTLQDLCSSLNVSIRIVHDAQDIVNKALGKA
ncbi:TIGR03279 family radical SAM protein [Prochlorococcus marinus]|uniref:TIGR03279 family radical SAM protein n=1 Tax=Prochlorococcus marinus XMU1408 TaxID=2213228 RepID=A0A318RCP7_PROMR|nr:TIGR03279 family radical SAM protein [Prochlorococcus marinus]MBW3041160.1 TIGR03279 family radical SAM protein [Prochlorococcus marinus str. XMU1408]PYE03758.1 TIGR03279 family radical SAM protein [Prochlorococcus marinus XMU1408]